MSTKSKWRLFANHLAYGHKIEVDAPRCSVLVSDHLVEPSRQFTAMPQLRENHLSTSYMTYIVHQTYGGITIKDSTRESNFSYVFNRVVSSSPPSSDHV